MRLVAAFACAVMLSAPTLASAQPGSTGGTIGKMDKEISGGEESSAGSRTSPRSPSRTLAHQQHEGEGKCKGIAGKWAYNWTVGINEAIFNSDGTGSNSDGRKAKWTCSKGLISVVWDHGVTDHVTLSDDGKSLSGKGALGVNISATKR
jgi:hypothetical protein